MRRNTRNSKICNKIEKDSKIGHLEKSFCGFLHSSYIRVQHKLFETILLVLIDKITIHLSIPEFRRKFSSSTEFVYVFFLFVSIPQNSHCVACVSDYSEIYCLVTRNNFSYKSQRSFVLFTPQIKVIISQSSRASCLAYPFFTLN